MTSAPDYIRQRRFDDFESDDARHRWVVDTPKRLRHRGAKEVRFSRLDRKDGVILLLFEGWINPPADLPEPNFMPLGDGT